MSAYLSIVMLTAQERVLYHRQRNGGGGADVHLPSPTFLDATPPLAQDLTSLLCLRQ